MLKRTFPKFVVVCFIIDIFGIFFGSYLFSEQVNLFILRLCSLSFVFCSVWIIAYLYTNSEGVDSMRLFVVKKVLEVLNINFINFKYLESFDYSKDKIDMKKLIDTRGAAFYLSLGKVYEHIKDKERQSELQVKKEQEIDKKFSDILKDLKL